MVRPGATASTETARTADETKRNPILDLLEEHNSDSAGRSTSTLGHAATTADTRSAEVSRRHPILDLLADYAPGNVPKSTLEGATTG